MNIKNIAKKYGSKAAIGTALTTLAIQAYAAVPTEVTAAIDASKDDGLEVGWIVIGVVAALFVLGICRRQIK